MKRGKGVGNEELGWLPLYSMASEFPCVRWGFDLVALRLFRSWVGSSAWVEAS